MNSWGGTGLTRLLDPDLFDGLDIYTHLEPWLLGADLDFKLSA